MRSVIAHDGGFLITDIRCTGRFETDKRNPLLAVLYGYSLTSCLQSTMSEPGGMALGTLGIHPDRLRELVKDNGFAAVALHDVEDPSNLYYEVRSGG